MKYGKAILFLLALVCIVVGTARISTGAAAGTPTACSWKIVSTPKAGLELFGVAAISSKNIWVVGLTSTGTLTEQWNGKAWNVIPSPNPGGPGFASFNAVAAVSTKDIWAVGSSLDTSGTFTTLAEHWDGTAWTIVPTPNPNPGTGGSMLNSLSAVSSNDVWAVGQTTYDSSSGHTHTLTEHWDGTAWSVVTSPNPGINDNLKGVAATSANDIWAVGSTTNSSLQTTALVEHWDGTAWTAVTLPKLGNFSSLSTVAVVSANDIWTVGNKNSGTLALHWNGTTWSSVSIPNPGGQLGTDYSALAVVSANDIWAVGIYFTHDAFYHTVSAQWNGTSWSRVASPSPQPNFDSFDGVTVVPGTTQVWAVGFVGPNQPGHSLAATHC